MRNVIVVSLLALFITLLILGAAVGGAKVHPWWVPLTSDQARVCLELGRQWNRQGYCIGATGYGIFPAKSIGGDIMLKHVKLDTLGTIGTTAGWSLEERNSTDSDWARAAYALACTPTDEVEFGVYLTRDSLDTVALTSIGFAAETDKGVRFELKKTGPPTTSLGSDGSHSWINCSYNLKFNADTLDTMIMADTKWLRLWVIVSGRRTPITFWLDGSSKIQYCSETPQIVTLPRPFKKLSE